MKIQITDHLSPSFYTFSIICQIGTDWQTTDVVVNFGKIINREKQVSG